MDQVENAGGVDVDSDKVRQLVARLAGLVDFGGWELTVEDQLVLTAGASRCLGSPVPTTQGSLLQRFPEGAAQQLGDAIACARHTGQGFELTLPLCGSPPRWLRLDCFPTRPGAETPCGLIRDVTHAVEQQHRERHREERRARLWESVTLAEEQQQRTLARELHDQAGSSLASTLVRCRLIERSGSVDDARRHLDQLAGEISAVMDKLARLSRRLHPAAIDELGLEVVLGQIAATLQEQHRLSVVTEISLRQQPPRLVALIVYRMVEELFRNIVCHAKANTVHLRGDQHGDELRITVRDDGVGFDPLLLDEAVREGRLGLARIRERASLLTGEAQIESRPGCGTRVELRIPCGLPRGAP